jgi:hypothetical protein
VHLLAKISELIKMHGKTTFKKIAERKTLQNLPSLSVILLLQKN